MSIRILVIAGLAGVGAALALPAQAAPAGAAPGLETAQPTNLSAQRRQRKRAQRAVRGGGHQIACNRWGCRPIPRNCRITTEYNPWTGSPTGHDAVVCR